jgi:hypothetical protein
VPRSREPATVSRMLVEGAYRLGLARALNRVVEPSVSVKRWRFGLDLYSGGINGEGVGGVNCIGDRLHLTGAMQVGPGGISGRPSPPPLPWGSAASGEGTVAALLRRCVPSLATQSGLDSNWGGVLPWPCQRFVCFLVFRVIRLYPCRAETMWVRLAAGASAGESLCSPPFLAGFFLVRA